MVICSSVLILLSGCVMIPYETPEARKQIEHDLKLSPNEIRAITETNWCFYPYGSEAACKATQGLGVLTGDGLVLSLYSNKTYSEVERISSTQIMCAKTVGGRDAEEVFVVFTSEKGIMLAPITPGGQLNMPVKRKFFDYLLGRGQQVFRNADGIYVRETSKKRTVGGVVPNTAVTWHAQETIWEVFNPCPAGN